MGFTIKFAVVPSLEVTHRVIRNPNYGGGPCDVPGTCTVPIFERVMKPKFFAALDESVRREGFRNPILVYRTSQGFLLSFGGSRLRVAKRQNLMIPAIVVDYVGDVEGPEVTPDNWREFFTDPPVLFEFTDYGVDTHYSLERNRRNTYDPQGFAWADLDSEFIKEEFEWVL